MYPFYLEIELIKPVSEFFKNQGYLVYHEIKIGFCIADLVGFKKNETVAVELKLSDWKKAIVQARNYQFGADYVYLAFPLKKSFNVFKKAEHILKKEGIGFLVVEEKNCDVRKILDAKPSKNKICSITLEEFKRNQRNQRKTKFKRR